MEQSNPAPMEQALRSLSRNGATVQFLLVGLPAALGVALVAAIVAGWKMGVVMLVFGLPMILVMALAVQALHVWPQVRRLRAAINNSQDIVWVYSREQVGRKTGEHHYLCLGLIDGQFLEVQTTHLSGPERQSLFDGLCERSPQATQGYSAEHLRTFSKDPGALRN